MRPLVQDNGKIKAEELLAALAEPELRAVADGVIGGLALRPSGVPGLIRQEIRDTVRLIRQEANDTRIRLLQAAIAEATVADDRDGLTELSGQLLPLLAARRSFDPPLSPYFRDLRTTVERR